MAILPVLSWVKEIINPVAKLIDNIHTSEAERLELKNKLAEIEFKVQDKLLAYETQRLEFQSKVIQSEALGHSWIQRNWRPMTMLVFVFMIAYNYIIASMFSLNQLPLPDHIWTVIEIGLGGYIGGRTLEKITPAIITAINQGKENKK